MARVIREGRDISERDTFSQCLECNEMDKVLQILWEKAQRSPKLKKNLSKYISEWAFRELEAGEVPPDMWVGKTVAWRLFSPENN